MAINNAQLQIELNTDPRAMGFAALISSGRDQDIANLLNSPSGVGAGSVANEPVTGAKLLEAVVSSELTSLTAANLNLFISVLNAASGAGLNLSNTNIRAILSAIFPALISPTTNANLVALRTRTGSRCEVLFGAGSAVTASDVSFALRGVR